MYKAQKDNHTKWDLICLVKTDFDDIGEVFNEETIWSVKNNQFKLYIWGQIKTAAFKSLKALQLGHSKVYEIVYT